MTISLFRRNRFILPIVLALVAVLMTIALQWQPLLERMIKSALIARGFKNPQLTLVSVNYNAATINDISFQKDSAFLNVKNATVTYSLPQLLVELIKTINATDINLRSGGILITAANAAIETTKVDTSDKTKSGEWQIHDLKIHGIETPLPAIQGRGNFLFSEESFNMEGSFKDISSAYHASFRVSYFPDLLDKSVLNIAKAEIPWNNGKVSVENASIPFARKRPVNIDIKVNSVSAEALMQQLTNNKAKASGFISGVIPVTIETDGNIIFREGKLQAEGPGTISVQPEVIPGDNEHVALLREALVNFHYNLFSAGVNSEKDGKLTVHMTLEGHNPDIQGGKLFKVNVNLRGDVLDFIQQNFLTFFNPRKIWEQDNDTKK